MSAMQAVAQKTGRHLILYDGVCGLCNRFTQFVLKRDRRRHFVYASLQSKLASEKLDEYGCTAADLDTVYVLANHGSASERLLLRSEAVLFVLVELGGVWNLARFFQLLPTTLLDRAYNQVASRRYRWFGELPACPVPSPEQRQRFLG
jgi:predicted DCC family thiol-disulfide oxidoreductase YuxK